VSNSEIEACSVDPTVGCDSCRVWRKQKLEFLRSESRRRVYRTNYPFRSL